MDAMHSDTFVDRNGVINTITCIAHTTGGLMLHYKLETQDAGLSVKKVLHSLIQCATYDEAHLEREKLKAHIFGEDTHGDCTNGGTEDWCDDCNPYLQ